MAKRSTWCIGAFDMIATIRPNGELTIPLEVRRAAHLDEGDHVEFEVTEQGILLRRLGTEDRDPPYYGTPEWEEGVDRALADAEAGKGMYYDSGEAFLEALRRLSKHADV